LNKGIYFGNSAAAFADLDDLFFRKTIQFTQHGMSAEAIFTSVYLAHDQVYGLFFFVGKGSGRILESQELA
jgi:hypothetical protein